MDDPWESEGFKVEMDNFELKLGRSESITNTLEHRLDRLLSNDLLIQFKKLTFILKLSPCFEFVSF